MSEPVLVCDGIAKAYGGVVALSDIKLEVRQGEILGLVGANGSGKSTLMDIIAGAQSPDAGSVRMNGTSIERSPTATRVHNGISRTFQMPQVARELTIRENVACGLSSVHLTSAFRIIAQGLRGLAGRRVDGEVEVATVCANLGLEEIDRPVERVSFGEMRLIEVARALIQRPQVVLLDEPFPGVGDAGLSGILSALKQISAQGVAVLLVDHNVDVVASVVDRIALLSDGEIVVEGDPQRCMGSPIFLERYIGVV